MLIIEHPLYLSYTEVASDNVFKELAKYLSYCVVMSIYYLYNKYVNEENNYLKKSEEGEKIYSVGSI